MADPLEVAEPASAHTLDRGRFQHALGETFFPLRLSAPKDFSGRISELSSFRLNLARVEGSRHAVIRTSDLIGSKPAEYYKLVLPLVGDAEVRQNGRRVTLSPGSASIYDASQPYSLEFSGDRNDTLVMLIEHQQAGLSPQTMRALTARPIRDDGGLGSVAIPAITGFARRSRDRPDAFAAIAADHVRELTYLMLGELSAQLGVPPGSARNASLFADVVGYIGEHLTDTALTPDSIAAAHQISVRYLHEIFRRNRLTVSAYIREMRLNLARRHLTDSAYLDRPVATIAALAGFSDASNFSRLFSARFGESASRYRTRSVLVELPAEPAPSGRASTR